MHSRPLARSKETGPEGTVNLLCWENPGAAELNLMKIIEFLGGTVNPIKLTRETASQAEFLNRVVVAGGSLILSAETLRHLGEESRRRSEPRELVASLARNAFIFGFQPGHSELIRALTSGSLSRVAMHETVGRNISVTAGFGGICRQFSGLNFEAGGPDKQFGFLAGQGAAECTPLISRDDQPFFVRVNQPGCELLLGCGDIANLDAPVPRGTSILQFFCRLAPALMFLHHTSKTAFWRNHEPAACFIIDDPLLTKQYGFLEYQKLLELMQETRFCTSIAFIPWNFNRSERRMAEVFASHSDRYSLSVHGCDHTRAEFGTTDQPSLREKAREALERMGSHRRLSGLEFDDIMVFPQGIFSTEAIRALKACKYLAAVNSTPYPVDAEDRLVLRDLLQAAVTRFSDFPLFTRRYPSHLAELAFDLFLGKPALLVEHHGFFRAGYDALAQTVEQLYGLDQKLQWHSLGKICSRACLKKTAANGDIHVWFFTDRFSLRNETPQAQRYVLVRREQPGAVKSIVVNGQPADFCQTGDFLRSPLSLDPGETAEVQVEQAHVEAPAGRPKRDRVYQAKVFIRRNLSEFRDNYLDRSRLLSLAARKPFVRKSPMPVGRQ